MTTIYESEIEQIALDLLLSTFLSKWMSRETYLENMILLGEDND